MFKQSKDMKDRLVSLESVDYKNTFTSKVAWLRLTARFIDMYVWIISANILWTIYFSGRPLPINDLKFSLLFFASWMFIEAFFLSQMGFTFGKWVVGLHVVDSAGQKLKYFVALERSFLAWLKFCLRMLMFSYCLHCFALT